MLSSGAILQLLQQKALIPQELLLLCFQLVLETILPSNDFISESLLLQHPLISDGINESISPQA